MTVYCIEELTLDNCKIDKKYFSFCDSDSNGRPHEILEGYVVAKFNAEYGGQDICHSVSINSGTHDDPVYHISSLLADTREELYGIINDRKNRDVRRIENQYKNVINYGVENEAN